MSYISGARNLKRKCCYNAKPPAYYLYVKRKVSVDFQICIIMASKFSKGNGNPGKGSGE